MKYDVEEKGEVRGMKYDVDTTAHSYLISKNKDEGRGMKYDVDTAARLYLITCVGACESSIIPLAPSSTLILHPSSLILLPYLSACFFFRIAFSESIEMPYFAASDFRVNVS